MIATSTEFTPETDALASRPSGNRKASDACVPSSRVDDLTCEEQAVSRSSNAWSNPATKRSNRRRRAPRRSSPAPRPCRAARLMSLCSGHRASMPSRVVAHPELRAADGQRRRHDVPFPRLAAGSATARRDRDGMCCRATGPLVRRRMYSSALTGRSKPHLPSAASSGRTGSQPVALIATFDPASSRPSSTAPPEALARSPRTSTALVSARWTRRRKPDRPSHRRTRG